MGNVLKYIILFYELGKAYARSLINVGGIPAGGTVGQVLKKKSGTDYDTEWGDGGGSITVDDEISSESENPVQNKVIKAALDLKANASSLGNKLDNDQGVAHAGDFMVVGSDGKITAVTMTAWQGGSY